jgi:hypothetical protein
MARAPPPHPPAPPPRARPPPPPRPLPATGAGPWARPHHAARRPLCRERRRGGRGARMRGRAPAVGMRACVRLPGGGGRRPRSARRGTYHARAPLRRRPFLRTPSFATPNMPRTTFGCTASRCGYKRRVGSAHGRGARGGRLRRHASRPDISPAPTTTAESVGQRAATPSSVPGRAVPRPRVRGRVALPVRPPRRKSRAPRPARHPLLGRTLPRLSPWDLVRVGKRGGGEEGRAWLATPTPLIFFSQPPRRRLPARARRL